MITINFHLSTEDPPPIKIEFYACESLAFGFSSWYIEPTEKEDFVLLYINHHPPCPYRKSDLAQIRFIWALPEELSSVRSFLL